MKKATRYNHLSNSMLYICSCYYETAFYMQKHTYSVKSLKAIE